MWENEGIPIKILHNAVGNTVTCETINGELFRGKLIGTEDNMNCQLEFAKRTLKNGTSVVLDRVLLRGTTIKLMILPDFLKKSGVFQKMLPTKDYQRQGQFRGGFRGGRGRGFRRPRQENVSYPTHSSWTTGGAQYYDPNYKFTKRGSSQQRYPHDKRWFQTHPEASYHTSHPPATTSAQQMSSETYFKMENASPSSTTIPSYTSAYQTASSGYNYYEGGNPSTSSDYNYQYAQYLNQCLQYYGPRGDHYYTEGHTEGGSPASSSSHTTTESAYPQAQLESPPLDRENIPDN